MAEPANPVDDPDDAAALAAYAAALADAVIDALPAWVTRAIDERYRAWRALDPPDAVAAAGRAAGHAAVETVEAPLRALLATDVDEQRSNPLAVVRGAVVHPTAVLRVAGMPPVVRDPQAEQLFPDDDYDLTPGSFADVDPALHEPGLVWGAAKAHVVLASSPSRGATLMRGGLGDSI